MSRESDSFDFDPVDMSEEDLDDFFTAFTDVPDSLAKPVNHPVNIITGDLIGSLGSIPAVKPDKIKQTLSTIAAYVSTLSGDCKVDELLQTIIACSDHSHLAYENYQKTFINVEKVLFTNPQTSIIFNNGISSNDLSNQLSFHMLRAYMRASEGNFSEADMIWDSLFPDWLEIDNKKSHLLLHVYLINLCMYRWGKSFDIMRMLWASTKSMAAPARHNTATWDNWTCCLLVTWFFALHIPEFCRFFKKKTGIFNVYYLNQKKQFIWKYLNHRFVMDLVSPSYYTKAREFHSSLPLIDT